MPAVRFHGWLVLIAAASVVLVRLGGPALWDDDEPKNAACSLAMLDGGDWCVPAFNGRLRVEKPPLVNWVQMVGFAVCGRNETGARIGSAVLTMGTCLLTWRTGVLLVGHAAGLIGGMVMATCVWTAVGGRAATPDAPLLFCTTLALFLYARGTSGGRSVDSRISMGSALSIGAACGAGTMAKGPIGLVLPLLALVAHAAWQSRSLPAGGRWAAVARIRPLSILFAAAAVAVPWYACVTIRTSGDWLGGFLLVHNLERFTSPMEGHSGSVLYYPGVIAVGLFPWSIVLLAMLAHAAVIAGSPTDARAGSVRLLACWAGAWIGVMSCAATKLPGYVWPAYPALSIATGVFLADWAAGTARFRWPWSCRSEALSCPAGTVRPASTPGVGAVMRLAWCILGATGPLIALALFMGARRVAPGGEWLAGLGLIPTLAALVAWHCQSASRPWRALAAVAVAGCLLVTAAASAGAERFSRAQGSRELVARLDRPPREFRWACLWNVPPSLVFYTGERIDRLCTPDEVARLLERHPEARVVIDSRQHAVVANVLPVGCGVLDRVPTLAGRDYLLLGRLEPGGRPAGDSVAVSPRAQPPWP